MTNCIGPLSRWGAACARNSRVLANFTRGRPSNTISPSLAGLRRGCGSKMKLLLMSQKQVPACKTPCALWTLERLLFRMGSFVPLKMLEARKGALAGTTDVRTRFICFWRWVVNANRCRLNFGESCKKCQSTSSGSADRALLNLPFSILSVLKAI